MKFFLLITATYALNQIMSPSPNLKQLIESFRSQRKLSQEPQQKIEIDLEMVRNKEQLQDVFVYDMMADPDRLQEIRDQNKHKKTLPAYLSDFSYIMFIGKTINKFYNQATGLIQKPEFDGINEQTKYGLNSYEDIKKAIQMFYNDVHFEAIRLEVEKFYNTLDRLVIRTSDCLEFFGLGEYFHGIKVDIDLDSPNFNRKINQLNLFVKQYSERIKEFFITLMNLKYFGDFTQLYSQYRKDDILENRLKKQEKSAIGTDLILRINNIQKDMKQGLKNIVILSEIGVDFRKMLILNLNLFKKEKVENLKLPDIEEKSEQQVVASVEQNAMMYLGNFMMHSFVMFVILFNQQ